MLEKNHMILTQNGNAVFERIKKEKNRTEKKNNLFQKKATTWEKRDQQIWDNWLLSFNCHKKAFK